jgi:hypothetical protein
LTWALVTGIIDTGIGATRRLLAQPVSAPEMTPAMMIDGVESARNRIKVLPA